MFSVRLHRARKAAGLSLRDLGERVGVSHAAIKKYEDGVAMPSSDILLGLSRALNVRTEYFFRPEPVTLEGIEYRKRSSLPKKRLDAITHEVMDQIERRIELENLFPHSPVKVFSAVGELPDSIGGMDEIETVAECIRKAWDLGFDPIPDLIDILETNGVRVFMVEAGADFKFDGLAARVDGMPIVVVGRHWPGDRQRFTLAHELGHLMLEGRLSEGLDEELACNRFAGAFLFPRPFVLQELGEHRNAIELKELGLLKDEFGLSMSGVLHRAQDLGVVSPAYRAEQTKLFRLKGWHVKEPGRECPAETPRIFEQLVFHALAEEYIGESKAAELMNMPLQKFRRVRSLEGGDAAVD
ncbi:helix-turn-helix domain-containing protein [Duganella sp. BJB1802]|uniref:helix-turn-helix domain-containing protein n=1 Tax=Duganella sp. BJB1802 TaxID=2744575 RepID=UPI001592D889|nr:XRE family transcriptional regulator [Duganella sp. BJB1802]NVD73656.1 helix-turn-helix domain-containing protein [Duganella sp. BJB1802]